MQKKLFVVKKIINKNDDGNGKTLIDILVINLFVYKLSKKKFMGICTFVSGNLSVNKLTV